MPAAGAEVGRPECPAVLLVVFNRPEQTRRAFQAVRARRPARLFVAADGPRPGVMSDAENTRRVRELATDIDWPCELHTLLREDNLGCARAVSEAITWFLSQAGEGIVLEDDCVPSPAFWDFCALMLERYRDDPRVGCVSGNNFLPQRLRPDRPYYFSRYPLIWGWATWQRAWQAFQRTPADAPRDEIARLTRRAVPGNAPARWWWRRTLRRYVTATSSTWDYRWTYANWRENALTIVPNRNLVANIGFDAQATHGRSDDHNPAATTQPFALAALQTFDPPVRPDLRADAVYNLHTVTGHNLLATSARSLGQRLPWRRKS